MDRHYLQNNAASRQRLRKLVSSLDDASLQLTVGEGWTVAALLAHLAFWDQSCLVRWDRYTQGGRLDEIPDAVIEIVIEIVNEANKPAWLALPGRKAADLALNAAAEVDARIEGLSNDAVRHAVEHGRRYMLDRSGHRTSHLDEIEQPRLAPPCLTHDCPQGWQPPEPRDQPSSSRG